MQYYRVLHKNRIWLQQCIYGSSVFFRMKGLLGRDCLSADESILLRPCTQIHMFFMRFPIDAVFLDTDNQILHIEHSIQPWGISKWVRKSAAVLECQAGSCEAGDLSVGDQIQFEEISPNT